MYVNIQCGSVQGESYNSNSHLSISKRLQLYFGSSRLLFTLWLLRKLQTQKLTWLWHSPNGFADNCRRQETCYVVCGCVFHFLANTEESGIVLL